MMTNQNFIFIFLLAQQPSIAFNDHSFKEIENLTYWKLHRAAEGVSGVSNIKQNSNHEYRNKFL